MRYQVRMHPTLDILVSSVGEVFVDSPHSKPHWTFGSKGKEGYMRVTINGKHYRVQRLVAEAFIPNPKDLPQVDHISRDKTANMVENLRWASPSQNSRNRRSSDRVDARGETHWYEDEKQFYRERSARRRKTHKNIRFSDGKRRPIPNSEALLLLALPVSQRIYKGD